MQGKPQDYMTVGVVHFMAFPETMCGDGPVVETVEQICRDDYFGAIEVTHVNDATARRRAADAVKASGKAVFFGAQPVLLAGKYDLNALDPARWREATDVARACLAEAREWNARGLALLSGWDVPADKRHLATGLLVAALKTVCETARRSGGMPVCLETFDRQPFAKNCLIGPTAEAVKVAAQVQPFYLDFGLLLDLSHLPLLGETPEQALKPAAPYLRHVHIGNCAMKDPAHPAYGDNHPPFSCPGGENDVPQLAAFLKTLLEIGYLRQGGDNVVSFEVKPYGDVTSAQTLDNAKRTLDAAWAKI